MGFLKDSNVCLLRSGDRASLWRFGLSRRIRYTWQTSLRRAFVVELPAELRVTDGKTGELICQGPAK